MLLRNSLGIENQRILKVCKVCKLGFYKILFELNISCKAIKNKNWVQPTPLNTKVWRGLCRVESSPRKLPNQTAKPQSKHWPIPVSGNFVYIFD
jgi:hypothetical protein